MRRFIPALFALTLASCRGEPTAVSMPLEPTLARASGGGSTTAPTVSGASPAIAPTDTVVDVIISGSGFAKGSTARWSIAGDTTQVQVLSNGYVNSSTLRARIAIPAGAPTGSYDIIVTNVGGKKGVGAELFEVVLGDPNTDWYFPIGSAAPAVGLRSDGLYLRDGQSVYGNGVCGVTASLFATTSRSGSGDAVMQTDNPTGRPRKCAEYPRTVIVEYEDGHTDRSAGFFNLRGIQNGAFSIPVGSTSLHGLAVSLSATGLRCRELRFNNIVQNGTLPVDASKLLVTRVSSATWHVRTQPAPNNKAYCMDNGAIHHLDVEFTVVSRTLPWLM